MTVSLEAHDLRGSLRDLVIRAQRHRAPHGVLRWLCDRGSRRAAERLVSIPGVEAAYLRHSRPAEPSFVAGASDLDLTLVLHPGAADDPVRLAQISNVAEKLARWHFYLEARDLRFVTAAELDRTKTTGATPFELLYRVDDWALIAGDEVARRGEPAQPADDVPWHPEFGKWWHHLLQEALFVRPGGRPSGYVRSVCRDAIKQKLQLRAALGGALDRPPGRLNDPELEEAFADCSETTALLREVREQGFWTARAEDVTERLVYRVLEDAADFYACQAATPAPGTLEVGARAQEDDGCRAALDAWLDALPAARGVLGTAIAYPIPFTPLGTYQLDLLLLDALPLDHFRDVVTALRARCQGRHVAIADRRFLVSVFPERTLTSALVHRGLPFPFLHEHIQRHGLLVRGAWPQSLANAARRDDRVRSCRSFMPFQRFNLRRRVEYSAGGLNLAHVAAIRLFLETGQIETTREAVRAAHREAFSDSPDEAVWSCAMEEAPSREDPSFASATAAVAAELDHVEALLDREPAPAPTG